MAELKKKLHGFKSKITAGLRSLSRRQRRLMILDVLLIGLVAAFYVLFFVPRDGTAMFQMAAQRSRRITSCVQDMSLKTELEISSKDLAFSQKKKSAAEKCPVQIRVKMKQGGGGAKINRTTKVTLNGKTSSFKTLSYYDAKKNILYSRKSQTSVFSDFAVSYTPFKAVTHIPSISLTVQLWQYYITVCLIMVR